MYFQLRNLIIWPKDQQLAPRVIEFELGKLNVITGHSRTGKSAIIPIIDYCLASSDCYIPIDTIRDYASWYGIIIQTDAERLLIARKVPTGNAVSNDFYIIRGSTVEIPGYISEANQNTDGIKIILNDISAVPAFTHSGNTDINNFQSRLSFRDLMAFIFQNQDIVANQNILFYKSHIHEHREKLRNWFPYILGAENLEILVARQNLQETEQKLRALSREYEKLKSISNSWLANLRGHLKVAKEYGLLNEDIKESYTLQDLIFIAKELVSNVPEHTKTSNLNVEEASLEMLDVEKAESEISTKISITKKRLIDIKQLKTGFEAYGETVRKRVDRLHLSQWITEIATSQNNCPICGSVDHPNSQKELSRIAKAFEKYEIEAKKVEKVPTSFSREEERLKSELDNLFEIKKALDNRYDVILSRDKKIQDEFQRNKNMFIFIGHLKASMETIEKISDEGEYTEKINELEKEIAELRKKTNTNFVHFKLERIINQITQGILKHLQTLDVESKYKDIPPQLNIKDLNILVQSNDGNWHALAEVGSASNWLSFHIALFCSLQEYFESQQFSNVPSFIVFDQPSQVYFPKVKRNMEDKDIDPKYLDEDVFAVKQIFNTISKSVSEKNGFWQCIILDHADDSIYGDIPGLYEVENWRDGKKLIPVEWYE